MEQVEIRNVKLGEFFRLTETGPVYVRDLYNRASKKFSAYKFDDVCASREFAKNRVVFVGFTF